MSIETPDPNSEEARFHIKGLGEPKSIDIEFPDGDTGVEVPVERLGTDQLKDLGHEAVAEALANPNEDKNEEPNPLNSEDGSSTDIDPDVAGTVDMIEEQKRVEEQTEDEQAEGMHITGGGVGSNAGNLHNSGPQTSSRSS